MNLGDTFPRRNLPPEAEEWGRSIEDIIIGLENGVVMDTEHISGQNRNSAATTQDLAAQVQDLANQTNRLNTLFRSLPIMDQKTNRTTGFSLSAGWQTIASVTFLPTRAGNGTFTASASGQLQTAIAGGNVEVSYRLVLAGINSPVYEGLYSVMSGDWRNAFSFSHSWTREVGEDSPLTVHLQANPNSPSTWPTNAGTNASITATAIFTV